MIDIPSDNMNPVAVYKVKVSDIFGAEYIHMFDDIVRFIIIQVSMQLLLVTVDSSAYSLFSADFFILLMFVVAGVMAYWLIFRKLVVFY